MSDVLYSVTTYMKRFFPSYPVFNRGVLQLLRRTPSKLDVSARKPKHETISLMDNKPRKIVNDLRLISLETNLAYYTEDFVLSALHKDRTYD